MWHLLQISGPLDCELGAALAAVVPITGWEPERVTWPFGSRARAGEPTLLDGRLRIAKVPLVRGFARWPLSAIARTGTSVTKHLLASSPSKPEDSTLLVTSPYFASVAEHWPGPVVYWLADLIARYGYSSFEQVAALDRRMCKVATLVCPNSERIASYLTRDAGCDPARICLLPNATRAMNLLARPSTTPAPPPADLADLPRPLAGVIGNLASNMDWVLLEGVAAIHPHLSWAMVGPTDMEIADPEQRDARRRFFSLPQVRSVGRKPYGDLVQYARSFDVAVLPYRKVEPTYSGSSTRFYEHLAAGRPILATRGFAELLQKEPLLSLVDTAEEAAAAIAKLEASGFDDGLAAERWLASQHGTWEERASTILKALGQKQVTAEPQIACDLRASAV